MHDSAASSRLVDIFAKAKVGDFGAHVGAEAVGILGESLGEKDVSALDIAMGKALCVEVLDAARNLQGDGHKAFDGEAAIVLETIKGFAQVASGHQLSDEKNVPRAVGPIFVVPSGTAKFDNVRVSQAGGVAQLSAEAIFGCKRVTHCSNAFDGDVISVVVALVDDGAGALAELVRRGAHKVDFRSVDDEVAGDDGGEIGGCRVNVVGGGGRRL